MNFKTKNIVVHPTDTIEEYVKEKEKKIATEMEEFETKGSGWTLQNTISLQLRINQHVPLKGSSFIELHKKNF